jgi:hypothetical protein
MRFLTLTTLTVLAGGLLAAADPSSITYVSGTVSELSPNTGATLILNSKSMELQTPLHKVQVPYSQISNAELGAIQSHQAEPEALYKVWDLPKRFLPSETRQMTVSFTSQGQAQNMTIELSKKAATVLMKTLENRSGAVANANWWGDGYWKTTRNKDGWTEPSSTIAQK